MRFLVIYEKGPNNYCAFVPNLPVICMSTGETVEEIERNIREAMEGHIEFTILDGDPILEPLSWSEDMEIRLQEGGFSRKVRVVFEVSSINHAAFVPDLPDCVWVGNSTEEVRQRIIKALEVYPKGLSWEGEVIPEPDSWGEFVEVDLSVPAKAVPASGD
jgi:predicted RNase H-like HicB family nuclease